jgi:acyl-CoA reductase-like NAD-dependent aldehyde dehydrogenase
MELGGNDPAIILPGTDIDKIADELFRRAFRNCGQVCVAVKRVYVHRDQQRSLVDALSDRARSCVVGDGLSEGTQLGPLNNQMQLNRVRDLVAQSRDSGALIVSGSTSSWEHGYFHQPTIIAGVGAGDPIVDEEQFGPALPVVSYDSVDDVVSEVNASPYGLTASVWANDIEMASKVTPSLEYGQVSINAHGSGVAPYLPFGGFRSSSFGVENGIWGLDEYRLLRVTTTPTTERIA